MTVDLDDLLSAPLAPVEDSGFSARVALRTRIQAERRNLLEGLVLLVGAGIFLAFAPLSTIGGAIEKVTFDLGNSLPVAIAFAALVLTASFARDRPE